MIIEVEMCGKEQGLVETVLQFLTVNFGSAPEEFEHLVQHANESTLQKLIENIFTLSKIDEVGAYF